jgi:hypothetical protein
MFVPVTTKPFLNSVNFKVLQWVSLHYFSLIKEKLTNILLPAKTGFTGIDPKVSFGIHTLRFTGLFNVPTRLRFAFGIGVSLIKEEFYNGKSSGI